jgi:ABC-2 type transport system permease protein
MSDIAPPAAALLAPGKWTERLPIRAGRVFQYLRARLLHNTLAVAFRQSSVRLITILLCSILVWGGVYAACAWGFRLFQFERLALFGGIVGLLFDLLFLSLTALLVFSSGIILYGSLFSSAEATFLLGTPAPADQVFAYKYQGAIAFSSWAFLLLGSPVLLAFGVVSHAPWYFYLLLPCFFLGFVLLPGSIGALACLVIANWAPRRPRQLLITAAVLVVAGLGWWGYWVARSAWTSSMGREWLQRLLDQLTFTQGPLVPSHWIARGLQAAARGSLGESMQYLGLVWSNGLFVYVLTAWTAARLYRPGYDRVAAGGSLRRRYGGGRLDRMLTRFLPFLDGQTRLLIVKDFRTFRRDPVQWAQVLIFSGLLTLYFANTRRFYNEEIGRTYQNAISLLNLAATALLLCSYTGRFIYPMLSLEGRKFWILGLLPLPRERLLWGEFAFSTLGALVISETLVILSDLVLGMGPGVLALHMLTIAVLAVGLSGLSVGLGAIMPNFREGDPSKIAVGFGGTLNLVTGLLFLFVVIALMAAPYHLYAAASLRIHVNQPVAYLAIAGGIVLGMLLGATAAIVPLRMGARALRRMEF